MNELERLRLAIEAALVALQTLALTDQLGPKNPAIGSVAAILVDALRPAPTPEGEGE